MFCSSTPVCQRWRSTTKPQLYIPLQALSSPFGILWFSVTFTLCTIYQNTFRHLIPWTLQRGMGKPVTGGEMPFSSNKAGS